LRDISTVLADEDAGVVNLSSHTDRKSMQTIMDISIEIRDLPTLSTVISRLEQLPNVTRVKRRS
jgi:GTP pyrophosphokinase